MPVSIPYTSSGQEQTILETIIIFHRQLNISPGTTFANWNEYKISRKSDSPLICQGKSTN